MPTRAWTFAFLLSVPRPRGLVTPQEGSRPIPGGVRALELELGRAKDYGELLAGTVQQLREELQLCKQQACPPERAPR